jgi:hypothetical protein
LLQVLILDEAYMLGDSSPYTKSVVDTIVSKVQAVPGDDIAVLLLGYKGALLLCRGLKQVPANDASRVLLHGAQRKWKRCCAPPTRAWRAASARMTLLSSTITATTNCATSCCQRLHPRAWLCQRTQQTPPLRCWRGSGRSRTLATAALSRIC